MHQAAQIRNQPNRKRSHLVFYGFLFVSVIYLILEHTAHTLGALPYLLFLICPLMHLLMHGGNRCSHGYSDHGAESSQPNTGGQK
ncbi:DUF2933 domain-containing protein [Synechococcus sp. A10-1-5-1]|uniref:DUF2933 domain-containing protein n=1 Tax=Synechococcus sp. A10-1-5-1 TaxID=2936507 RepID=UPI0035305218